MAFVIAAIVASIASLWRPRRAIVIAVAVVVGCAALIPVGGLSVVSFVLAFPGAPSAATLMLCAQALHAALADFASRSRPSTAFLACIVASGMLLYPMAAGLGPFDPYDLGYRGLTLPALMATIVVVGWLYDRGDVPVWIGGAAALFLSGALTTNNLWDYLIDPLAFVAALVILGARIWARFRQAGTSVKTPSPPVHRRAA